MEKVECITEVLLKRNENEKENTVLLAVPDAAGPKTPNQKSDIRNTDHVKV